MGARQGLGYRGGGSRIMWFVRAIRNKTDVMLPCYEGEDEALRIRGHLIGYGWDAKVTQRDSKQKAAK